MGDYMHAPDSIRKNQWNIVAGIIGECKQQRLLSLYKVMTGWGEPLFVSAQPAVTCG